MGMISSIIMELMLDKLNSELSKLITEAGFSRFIVNSKLAVEEFVTKNDGTIITSGNFENYLTYQKPIEKIYEFVLNPESTELGENKFIQELVKHCKDSMISLNGVCNTTDETILRDLFSMLLKSIKEYLINNLDMQTRYAVYKNKQTGEKVIGEVTQKAERLERGIEEVKDLLKKKNEINDDNMINKIYNLLNEKLWNGNLDEVYDILPLLQGKSEDLEYGIKISLGIMSDYNIGIDFSWNHFEKINNVYIKDDVARKIVLYNFDDKAVIKAINGRASSKQLNEIIKGLLDDDMSQFFTINIENRNGMQYHEYKLSERFYNEIWLVKRICLFYLYKKSLFGIAEIMESLIKNDSNYIDNILILEQKENELLSDHIKERDFINSQLITILNQLKQTKKFFVHSCNMVQKKFFLLWLRTEIIVEPENVSAIYTEFPEWIKDEEEIQELIMQLQITDATVTENDVVKLCMRTGRYWLLNNYLIQWSQEPQKILGILEKYKFILDEDIRIYLMYLQASRIVNGKQTANNLLIQYEEKYGDYLEFLLEKLINFKDINIVDSVLIKQKNNELKLIDLQTELEFIEILMYFKKYDEAAEIIKKYEEANRMSSRIYRMKAGILMSQGNMIDALDIFVSNFKSYQRDEYVIDTIIAISLENKRQIQESVLNAACDIGTSRLLMLSAIAYERNERYELSKKYMTMALLRTNDDNQDIFGSYLGLHLKEDSSDQIKIKGADTDTTLYLKNIKTDEQKIYCIHREKLLPEEPYIWENAVHIYIESAIQLGLLRKKSGMTVVIESDEYIITEIMPLECHFFRTCMDKMVNSGIAKAFSIETKEDEIINQEKFLQWIKDNTPDESSFKWLENYKNMNNIPVTIYSLCRFTRLTYEQLILALLEEKSIIIRELIVPLKDLKSDGYILSFSAIVMLYKLGVPVSLLYDKNVVVSESAKQEVKEESEIIVNGNNREHVSSMGVHNGQIFIQVSTEEEKQQWMSDAIGIRSYCEKMQTIDNNKDITIEGLEKLDLKKMFGICDYDTFSIAMNTNRKIVSAEVLIMVMSRIENSKIPAIGLLDFLCELEIPVIELISYIHKMIEFRFLVTITLKSISYISEKYDEASEAEKSSIYLLWDKLLAIIDTTDDEYKMYFTQIATDIMRNKYEGDIQVENIIWRIFSLYVMKYNNFRINVSANASGELEITTYKIGKE
ncbi:hypothetical protein [Lacrimispora sp.]|uniref:hypothetical protein n=1 Tax=Lacrimispora sp. TaxID=2719234 RepID=UPI0028ACC247|nr:hypothetical protein [Lacrimispora sp.]